jgi:choline dehydrogenase-like flavoprotein
MDVMEERFDLVVICAGPAGEKAAAQAAPALTNVAPVVEGRTSQTPDRSRERPDDEPIHARMSRSLNVYPVPSLSWKKKRREHDGSQRDPIPLMRG